MYDDVAENTAFRVGWPEKHQEVMLKLTEISVDNQNIKTMLREIKSKQSGHSMPAVDLK
jgi:vacuolar-type H+-ATPase subunit C/Vma6